MTKKQKFINLFDEIYKTNVCSKDLLKVKRNIGYTNIHSKVMIIGEALAPNSARVSGINYFHKDGTIGNTGKNLEKFLNPLGYTVYPQRSNTVYHTEIVNSFPGYIEKNGKRIIRKPTKKEITESLKTRILEKEISLLNPRLIILMGSTSYKTFCEYFLKQKKIQNLSSKVLDILKTKKLDKFKEIQILPIQHPSGANPRFSQMLSQFKVTDLGWV
ncbi:uracil-DNA glycosylase family protein [Candidatus Dojkabacteria bacterium]|jgi:uracil-DNA glycosylase family 4|nr:uracil-DNA glycosylase family protein [Candidatus Dojkabacteria bacterium]